MIFVLLMTTYNNNSIHKKITDYVEYLYFNWINYPKNAEKLDILEEDINKELFSWFGYDENGIPVDTYYTNIEFKYNGRYIIEKNYIAFPFESNGQIYYKKILINKKKVTGFSKTIW